MTPDLGVWATGQRDRNLAARIGHVREHDQVGQVVAERVRDGFWLGRFGHGGVLGSYFSGGNGAFCVRTSTCPASPGRGAAVPAQTRGGLAPHPQHCGCSRRPPSHAWNADVVAPQSHTSGWGIRWSVTLTRCQTPLPALDCGEPRGTVTVL